MLHNDCAFKHIYATSLLAHLQQDKSKRLSDLWIWAVFVSSVWNMRVLLCISITFSKYGKNVISNMTPETGAFLYFVNILFTRFIKHIQQDSLKAGYVARACMKPEKGLEMRGFDLKWIQETASFNPFCPTNGQNPNPQQSLVYMIQILMFCTNWECLM